jgi:Stress responsive A/B Barrel Domain
MIVNLLRFRFRDDVDDATRERALAAIRQTAAVDSVAFSVIGQDLGDPSDGYTHSYCVGVPDLAALARYLDHPAHRKGDELFLPLLAKLTRSASSDDMDPLLRTKIGALVREKMAADPTWAALFELIPDLRLG